MDYQLTENDIAVINKSFGEIDQNGDRKFNVYELKRAAQSLGANPTTDDVRAMMKNADVNGDAYVTYEEYKEMMRQHIMALAYEREMLMRAFQTFDKDKSGYISKSELKRVLQSRGEDKLTEEETEEFFQDFDTDENGKICIEEFIQAFCASDQDYANTQTTEKTS